MAANPRSFILARVPAVCAFLVVVTGCGELPSQSPQAKTAPTENSSDEQVLFNLYASARPPSRHPQRASKFPPLPQLEIAAAEADAVLQPSDREIGVTDIAADPEPAAEQTPRVLNLVHEVRIGEFGQGKQTPTCPQATAPQQMPSITFETKVIAATGPRPSSPEAEAPIAAPTPNAAISTALAQIDPENAEAPDSASDQLPSIEQGSEMPTEVQAPPAENTVASLWPRRVGPWEVPIDPESAAEANDTTASVQASRVAPDLIDSTGMAAHAPDTSSAAGAIESATPKAMPPVQTALRSDPVTPTAIKPKPAIKVLNPPPPALLPSASVARVGAAGSSLLTALLVMCAGSALATLFTAWRFARTAGANGTGHLRMTLRTRFALASGGAATLLLALCWAGVWEMSISPAYPGALAAQVQLAALALASATIVIGCGVWMFRSVASPVDDVLAQVRSIGAGNLLTPPINSISKDEVGELARATDKLAAYIKDALTEVAISTAEVEGAARQVLDGTTAASKTLGSVAERCASVAASAATSNVAEAFTHTVMNVSAHLREAEQTVCAGVNATRTIADRGRAVGTLVEAINDLSQRTRLVALNASIESVKVGVSGRAFVGVAQEVQRLADRARLVADRAADTLRSMDNEARGVDQRLTKGAQEITQGAQLACRTGEDLTRLSQQAGAMSSELRTLGSAVEDVGAGASQSASMAAQLTMRADELKATVGRFKLDAVKIMSRSPSAPRQQVETFAAAR